MDLQSEGDLTKFLGQALSIVKQITDIFTEMNETFQELTDIGKAAVRSKTNNTIRLGFATGGAVVSVAAVAVVPFAAPAVVAAAGSALALGEGAVIGAGVGAGAVGVAADRRRSRSPHFTRPARTLRALLVRPCDLAALSPPAAAAMSLNLTSVALPVPFDGFGTSLAWWANGVLSQPALDRILDLLFSPTQLNLAIARFNIGGTTDPTKNPNFRTGANVPADTAISPQLAVMQRIVAIRSSSAAPLHVEAFSNSPPQNLTISGTSAGAAQIQTDCITPANVPTFAQFLLSSVRTLISSGVPVESLSPINEPSEVVWVAGNTQEGCYWSKDNRVSLATTLRTLLASSGTGVKLALADENNPSAAVDNAYMLAYADLVNIHTYTAAQFTNSSLASSLAASQDTDAIRASLLSSFRSSTPASTTRKLIMSEYTLGGTIASSSPQSVSSHAVGLIRHVARDLATLQPAAWVYWQAVEDSTSGTNYGLVQAPFTNAGEAGDVILGAQYYAMWMLTRVLPPGTTKFDQVYDTARVALSNPAAGTILFANSGGGDPSSATGGGAQATFWFPQQTGQFNVTRLQTTNGVATLTAVGFQTGTLGAAVAIAAGTVELWVGNPSAAVGFPSNASAVASTGGGAGTGGGGGKGGAAVVGAAPLSMVWTLLLCLLVALMV
ncbi:glycoside hydrolase family 30 protein, partial [Gonapodya prolifera JEL478]